MRVLLDQGAPAPLRRILDQHVVVTAFECGWQTLTNGDLLNAAEAAGHDAIITTDKNLRYQQNLAGRKLAIMVLPTTDWRRIRTHAGLVVQALGVLTPGAYVELSFPEG